MAGTRTAQARRAVLIAVVVVALGGCSPHPVGPARTFDAYERKARTTAEGAISAVATVQLATETAAKNGGFGPYLSVLVSNQEEALSGLQGTFASIQPPDRRADALRSQLDGAIGDALQHVVSVRVALRRGELGRLGAMGRVLDRDLAALRRFQADHDG